MLGVFIGIIFDTYIIIEMNDEMYIIDQNAANEKIMYEKIRANYYNDTAKDSQLMLLPDIITLNHKQMEIAKDNMDIFEKAGALCKNYKAVCNWLTSDIARILNEKEMEPDQIPFTAENLAELVELIDKGTISTSIGKKVLEELFENPRSPKQIIEEKGLVQISDENQIKKVVEEILANNSQSVADYKAGKDRALGFLVGQAMKQTKGKANPKMLNEMFLKELNK